MQCNRCRLGGLYSDADYLDKGMKAQFKLAANYNARFVAIYGATEKEEGMINVKDQDNGTEVRIKKEQLYNHIVAELMKPSHSCQDCSEESCDDCE